MSNDNKDVKSEDVVDSNVEMLNINDIRNIRAFLERSGSKGAQEASILVHVCRKLEAIIALEDAAAKEAKEKAAAEGDVEEEGDAVQEEK